MGESTDSRTALRFDRPLRLEFHGSTITSDAGLLACRELDDALGLTETASACLQESRGGRNVQHQLVALLTLLVTPTNTDPSFPRRRESRGRQPRFTAPRDGFVSPMG